MIRGEKKKILIGYHTFTGNTEKMAKAVAEGARAVTGIEVVLKKVTQLNAEDFVSADAVALGAPNTFGGMAGAMREFFDRAWEVRDEVAGKPAVAFTSENPGETKALREIERFFDYYKLRKIAEGIVSAKEPGEREIDACRKLGKSLAQSVKK